MKYIGLSLGGCLRSIIADEVSEDDVMFIVTRTMCPDFDRYIKVVEQYHAVGNPYARDRKKYELNDYQLEEVTDLATRLWNTGKIHQPRVIVEESLGLTYSHPVGYGDGLWMEVVPSNRNTTPAVIAAYNHYKMLDSLTNDRN
jgi:hypothetical protein